MLRKFPHFPSRTPWHQRGARGFTLLELMAVVILIGILAVIAIPGAARAMRERRSASAAHEIAMVFNQARARAIARGAAVLVRYDPALSGFEVREAILGSATGTGGCELAPVASCTVPANRWEPNVSSPNQLLYEFKPLGTSTYEYVQIQFTEHSPAGNSVKTAADICMTPGGQVFYRASSEPTTPFTRMQGNHEFRVWMEVDSAVIGVERSVFVLSNGTARVAL